MMDDDENDNSLEMAEIGETKKMKKKTSKKTKKKPKSERSILNDDDEKPKSSKKTKKKPKSESSILNGDEEKPKSSKKTKKKPKSERSMNETSAGEEKPKSSKGTKTPERDANSNGEPSNEEESSIDDSVGDSQRISSRRIHASARSVTIQTPEDEFEVKTETEIYDEVVEEMPPEQPPKKKKPKSKQKSTGLSVPLHSRLDSTLISVADNSDNDSEDSEHVEVIDVEELMEMNHKRELQRQTIRKKREKTTNRHEGVDPRLFLSYYEKKGEGSNSGDNENDDDDASGNDDSDGGEEKAASSRVWRAFSHRWPSVSNILKKSEENDDGNDMDPSNKVQVVSAIRGRKIVQLRVIPLPATTNDPGTKRKVARMLKDSENEGMVRLENLEKDTTPFGSPIRLLEIEMGRAILVRNSSDEKKKSRNIVIVVSAKPRTFPKVFGVESSRNTNTPTKAPSLSEKIAAGNVRDLKAANPEFGTVDRLQHEKLRLRLKNSLDHINALGLGRKLQPSIPFLTGYEAYLLQQVVEVLDGVASELHLSKESRQKVSAKLQTEFDEILRCAFKNQNVSRIIEDSINLRWNFHTHWFQLVSRSRWYDARGCFPPTENFPTPDYSIHKFWLKDPSTRAALNVSEECNGFEVDYHKMFGTTLGRAKTNELRIEARLPMDECILHAFVASPMPTMIHNGSVYVLRILAKHWQKILAEPFGNFVPHRMEQLDPFQTMRFHIPHVCVVLSSLRGRNAWDSQVLGPFIRKCQELNSSFTVKESVDLISEMRTNIVPNLCAGIVAIESPLSDWLDSIQESCLIIEEEAKSIYKEVAGVEIGLRFGYDLITQVSWKIPSNDEIEAAILLALEGRYPGEVVQERNIRKGLSAMTPRDKRTLMGLVKLEQLETRPTKVLMARVRNLVKRDIRREFLNDAIQELSSGGPVFEDELVVGDWYWVDIEDVERGVYILKEKLDGEDDASEYCFVCAESGAEEFVTFDDLETAKCQQYIPVAESIVRAQRCYMNLELDRCHKFKYEAFAEFSFLRTVLGRLAVVSQIFCEELDKARLNLLAQMKTFNQVKVEVGDLEPGKTYYIHNKQYHVYAPFICKKKYSPSDPEWEKLRKVKMVKIPPQSITIVGGSITALITAIHCAENVLVSGGDIKLYQSSNANVNFYERAQIVRLDARWIAMLRYHMGSVFEDVFIPNSGESNATLGNNLVSQGFVEIVMKELESMLNAEVTKLWSKAIVQVITGSKVRYDPESNALTKLGENLELGDRILRRVDPNGNTSEQLHRWRVSGVRHTKALGIDDLRIGEEYNVYVEEHNAVLPFKLSGVNTETRTYNFESKKKRINDIQAPAKRLPSIYPKGTKRESEGVNIKCETKGESKEYFSETMSEKLHGEKFVVDVGHSHVIECMGKPRMSTIQFQVTPSEPYGFCCLSRVNGSITKPSRMKKFLSADVQNTRIIGNSTKLVRLENIALAMLELIDTEHWQRHFEQIVEFSDFASLNDRDPIVTKLVGAVGAYTSSTGVFRRQYTQLQLFETGDNFYLSMEFPREYENWKYDTVNHLLASLEQKKKRKGEETKPSSNSRKRSGSIEELRKALRHGIDRLWFEASLVILRHNSVYNAEKNDIPEFQLVNSIMEKELRDLSVGDSFRVADKMKTKFEILVMNKKDVFARNGEGKVQQFEPDTKVIAEGNLARSMDGDSESEIAVASFPVAHFINHRSIRLNDWFKGYVFASFGDQQSTSHFMRNSGLTGGCVNVIQFNTFIKVATDGVDFIERSRSYSRGAHWSNGEVIQKGTTTLFGEDGFLRPGFSYHQALRYFHARATEVMETKQSKEDILSHEWKVKFAASMIPRGMEVNGKFIKTLKEDTLSITFDIFVDLVLKDKMIKCDGGLEDILRARRDEVSKSRNEMNYENYWKDYIDGLDVSIDDDGQKRLEEFHCEVARQIHRTVCEIIDTAKEAHLYDRRFGQELWNQPKAVDFIVDDFALDANIYPAMLFHSVSLSALSVALSLYASRQDFLDNVADICCIVISILNMILCFRILTRVGMYKHHNEQVRSMFSKNHFLGFRKAVYSAMYKYDREDVKEEDDPFFEDLERRKKQFVEIVSHYGLEDPDEFIYDYRRLLERKDQPAAYKHFQRLLITYYIPDVYQVNSYVQDSLVELYNICDEIRTLLTKDNSKKDGKEMTRHLFYRITKFGFRSEKSLKSGIMRRDTFIILRYFWSSLCLSSSRKVIPLSTIENETYGIIKETEMIEKTLKGYGLKRHVLDLKRLHKATREIDKASMVFVLAYFSFGVSMIFAASRLWVIFGGGGGDGKVLIDVVFFFQLANMPGGFLSLLYYLRTTLRMLWIWIALGDGVKNKAGKLGEEAHYGLRKVRSFTFVQLFLTLFRIEALLCSMISLPWAVARYAFPEEVQTKESLILYIALAGFCLATGTVVTFSLVNYSTSYKLPPNLGEPIGKAFQGELESMYRALSLSKNKIDMRGPQERITWEYVAQEFFHKYRFDVVFGVDRFSAIFHYLQCGVERRDKTIEGEEQC